MAKIDPSQLLEIQFSKKMRGFDPQEVTSALRDAAETIDDLQQENDSLKSEKERLVHDLDQYQKLQESLNAALITAQKTAEDTRASAKRESDSIIKEAQAKAKEILFAVRQAIRKNEDEMQKARYDKERFLSDFEALLNSHLDWIHSLPKDPVETVQETIQDELPEELQESIELKESNSTESVSEENEE